MKLTSHDPLDVAITTAAIIAQDDVNKRRAFLLLLDADDLLVIADSAINTASGVTKVIKKLGLTEQVMDSIGEELSEDDKAQIRAEADARVASMVSGVDL